MKDLSHASKSFEYKKWSEEKGLREREIDLKKRELDKSVWSNPLLLALCGAMVAAIANIYVAADNARQQRELETFKAEQARILEAIRTGSPDKAAENLQFMLDTGLILNPTTAALLKVALSKRLPGKGPSLPANETWNGYKSTGSYGFNLSNPTTAYVADGCDPPDKACSSELSKTNKK